MRSATVQVRVTVTAEYDNPQQPPVTVSGTAECECVIPDGSALITDDGTVDLAAVSTALTVGFEQITGSEFEVLVRAGDSENVSDVHAAPVRLRVPWWHARHSTSWEVVTASVSADAEQ